MAGEKRLLDLRPGTHRAYDFSSQSRVLRTIGDVLTEKKSGTTTFRGGYLKLDRSAALDQLKSFTIEATIKVTPHPRSTQMMIIEAQTPPIRLSVRIERQRDCRLVGEVYVGRDWIPVQSRNTFRMGQWVQVRFIRDVTGKMKLELDGREVGTGAAPGHLTPRGNDGFTIGSDTGGARFKFFGEMAQLRIYSGERSQADIAAYQNMVASIKQSLADQLGQTPPNTIITVDPAEVDEKYEAVKSIMEYVGVADLADLSALGPADFSDTNSRIMSPGDIIVAPPKPADPGGPAPAPAEFHEIAERVIGAASIEDKKLSYDRYLTNRSSVRFIERAESPPPGMSRPESREMLGITSPPLLSEVINYEANRAILRDPDLLDNLRSDDPANWPSPAPTKPVFFSTHLPIPHAVIMASSIDLRDVKLQISHTVGTLYILAFEEIVFDENSEITWIPPGGSPAPGLPPASDGYDGYSPTDSDVEGQNVFHTYPPEDGGDGDPGEDGKDHLGQKGDDGWNAPSIQLWAKRISSIPNINLDGQNGFQGGVGQQGGRGGDGGDGFENWAIEYGPFGKAEYRPAGAGGDGGDGGDAGQGGKGGKGGKGGDIVIRVLGELEQTITNQRFKASNIAGRPGEGGPCGTPGQGGSGGEGGTGHLGFPDGDDGADGRPGRPRAGAQYQDDVEERTGDTGDLWTGSTGDGWWDFGIVTEAEFVEQLNRPWLTHISPTSQFPGNEITLYGARFADTDRVFVGPYERTLAISSETMATVTLPDVEGISSGIHDVYRVRHDGRESNRIPLKIRPQIRAHPSEAKPMETVVLEGRGFMPGSVVLYNGVAVETILESKTKLSFVVPAAGQANTTPNQAVPVQVKSMGSLSNIVQITELAVLDYGWEFSRHSFSFVNPDKGTPSFDTFKQTYGASEVWTEIFVPIFGHPELVPFFYWFYEYFLKGVGAGGLATGFCTAVASISCDEFWQDPGHSDTFNNRPMSDDLRSELTAIHGRLLSKEVLIKMHDQGREGQSRVTKTALYIEQWFKYWKSREVAPLLFFIPSGSIWDEGYFDLLGDSHCILPVQFEYAADQNLNEPDVLERLDGAKIYCYDSNHPYNSDNQVAQNCRVELFKDGDELGFKYLDGHDNQKFSFSDGVTLGLMTLGDYLLADVSMPFSGPLGFMEFVFDFVLSPADLSVEDSHGRFAGNKDKKIVAEISDSHPCYLIKNALLLPRDTALTRHITGKDQGKYKWCSIYPDGTFLALEEVDIKANQTDTVNVNYDATQLVFSPGTNKSYTLFLAKKVSDEFRTSRISGLKAGPRAEAVITSSPDLSLLRISNQLDATTADIQLTRTKLGRPRSEYTIKDLTISVSRNQEIAVAIPWNRPTLDAEADALPLR